MSYTLAPYFVDLDELRRVLGRRDEALLAAVIRSSAEDEEADEPEASTDGVDDEITVTLALRHLVRGEAPVLGYGHQYGYALEQLCRYLGAQPEERDAWCGIHWEVLEATGVDQVLEKSGPPVELPAISDFPTIGYLPADEITATVGKLGAGHLKSAAPSGRKPRRSVRSGLLGLLLSRIFQRAPLEDEDLRELMTEYESWLREAATKGKSLVFFYY